MDITVLPDLLLSLSGSAFVAAIAQPAHRSPRRVQLVIIVLILTWVYRFLAIPVRTVMQRVCSLSLALVRVVHIVLAIPPRLLNLIASPVHIAQLAAVALLLALLVRTVRAAVSLSSVVCARLAIIARQVPAVRRRIRHLRDTTQSLE
jgi:hypothetical protein